MIYYINVQYLDPLIKIYFIFYNLRYLIMIVYIQKIMIFLFCL